MWWGTSIEAPDPVGLARFCAELLGWHVGHEEPDTAIVAASPNGPFLVFQRAEGYRPPVWPPTDGDRRPMRPSTWRATTRSRTGSAPATARSAATSPRCWAKRPPWS